MKVFDTEKDLAAIEKLEQAEGEKIRSSSYALKFHLMPPVGWLNDPNGLCQLHGVYHIFFQYAPHRADGSSLKYWGHYQTEDFVHYEYTGILLAPDEEIDRSGVYSGSAYVEDDTMYLYYTGNVLEEGDYDYTTAGRQANTILVTTKDGITAGEKECLLTNDDYPSKLSCHVRDPKVWKENGIYYMVLGARTRQDEGCVLLFRSEDKRAFTFFRFIAPDKPFGYMWECPDIFRLQGKAFLSVSPQGLPAEEFRYQNVYQSGYFPLQEEDASFSDVSAQAFTEWDMGFDFYAPQTFLDEKGRRILIGWIGNPDAPYENPTVEDGWQHTLTLPRVLTLSEDGTRILQNPAEELTALRAPEAQIPDNPAHFSAPQTCELLIDEIAAGDFQLILDDSIFLSYAQDTQVFTLSFVDERDLKKGMCKGFGRTVRNARLFAPLSDLRIFVDVSCLEIFINGGRFVMTTRFYRAKSAAHQIRANGGCRAAVYELS